MTDSADVARRFNDCISARDAAGLAALMTDDHTFIDAADSRISGRAACIETWTRFFAAFPDYRNEFERLITKDDDVTIAGRSHCDDTRLDGPALWTARIVNGRVAEWRVLEDTAANRRRIGLPR